MRAPDEGRGLINLVVMAIILLTTIVGPLIERWRRRKAAERGQPLPGPEPAEPKLPYEDVIDEVFGPYMDRRRKAYEARRTQDVEEAEEGEEEAEPTPRPVVHREPVIRIIEEVPPPPSPVPVPPAPETPARRRSVDEIVFSNPRYSPGAKLIVASEILGRPRFLRRGIK